MAHFLHGWGVELTADDYAKATAAISVMEAFGISVAGGSFTHKLNVWRRRAHVSRGGSYLRWIVDQLLEAPRLSGAPTALVALPYLRLVVLALVQGSRARAPLFAVAAGVDALATDIPALVIVAGDRPRKSGSHGIRTANPTLSTPSAPARPQRNARLGRARNDRGATRHVIDELTIYSYEVDPHTGEVLPKLADNKNHTIDALR